MAASMRTCRASSLLRNFVEVLAGVFLCATTLPKHADRGAAADTTTGLEMLIAHCPHHGCLFKLQEVLRRVRGGADGRPARASRGRRLEARPLEARKVRLLPSARRRELFAVHRACWWGGVASVAWSLVL